MAEPIHISEYRIEDTPLSCTWIIVGPPGSGKCLAPGTPVMMFNGSTKFVEDIIEGDQLMGDDNNPRNVLGTCTGTDQMYTIHQDLADDYTANEPHILCLVDVWTSKVVEMTVKEYIEIENPGVKSNLRGYKIDLETGSMSISNIWVESVGKGVYHGFEIDGNGRFLLGDSTVTHNTTFIENMCYFLKHRYPVARAFIGTEGGYKRFCKIFHPLYVSSYYDEDEEKNHILRQRTCVVENEVGYLGNYAINVIDDASDDPKIYKTKVMKGLFKLGSQHWNQLLMVGSQYAIDMPPDVRKSVSYVAIFFEPEEIERKKLYTNFGGLSGSYENFCELMDQITGDYTCLIFKKRTQSKHIEENVSFYKTKQLGDWSFGSKEYREWGNERYDPNYIETIRM